MKITDAGVCPYPNGDSSVRRLALEAAALGFDSLVAIDTPSATYGEVEVRAGIFIRNAGMKDVIAQVKRAKDSASVISVKAGDAGFNRAVVSLRGVHILRGIHAADKNAFDHVTAKMAADSRVAIDIDLSVLIAGRGIARQRAIQRYVTYSFSRTFFFFFCHRAGETAKIPRASSQSHAVPVRSSAFAGCIFSGASMRPTRTPSTTSPRRWQRTTGWRSISTSRS